MATDDRQRLITGVQAAPTHWTVPGNGQIRPKTVFAHYDGTAAAGTFLPAIKITSDGGELVGVYPLPAAVAAGGSADVTWFRGLGLTAATAAGLPTTEVLFVNSTVGAAGVPATTVLTTGVSYLVSVQGTYSAWNEVLNMGTPEPNAIFPGPTTGRASLEVGIDADTLFAWPSDHPHVPGHELNFQIDLGSGFVHVEPFNGPFTTPAPDHFYTYTLVGQGVAPKFRVVDSNADNYGILKVIIYNLPGTGGLASVTAGDASISIGGTSAAPTVETASLDVIAGAHPTAANWANNSHKITALTAGAAAGEAAIWDQTPAGIVTAKGDLVVATGAHAATRIGVGADGTVLTADAAQADGIKWAAAGGSGTISDLTSTGGTLTIGSPTGPTTNVDMPTTGVGAGSYGDASHVPAITVDAEGRITAASSTAISSGVGNYVAIGSQVLGADAASMAVSGIPASYSHLDITIMTRTDESILPKFVLVSFNGDTTAGHYVMQEAGAQASALTAAGNNSNGGVWAQTEANGTSAANLFAPAVLRVPLYANPAIHKVVTGTNARFGAETGTSNTVSVTIAGLWISTAAITSVRVAALTGVNLKSGSCMYVYGVT